VSAKRNRLLVQLVLVAALAILMILPAMSCQQAQWGSEGVFFGFYGGGTTREPATETLVQISVMHTCVFDDELILEKVEICGESGIPVKTLTVDMTLNSVSGKLIHLNTLYILRWIPGAYERVAQEGAKLAEEIRTESFSTGYFAIDLRQIKQPLIYGQIPIIAKATLIHSGKRINLEREVTVEYYSSFT
jgi:hypothetical protein